MAGISMKELADRLGVSTASVSVALRGKSGISEQTRMRILAEARRLGYDMSRLSDTQAKGVIEMIDYTYYTQNSAPRNPDPYYSLFVDAATAAITKKGYTALGPIPAMGRELMADSSAQGYILLGAGMDTEQLKPYMEGSVPFVISGHPMEELPVTTVVHDNFYGIHSALRHLADLGHQRIGYVRSIGGPSGDERYEAYQKGMASLGFDHSGIDIVDIIGREDFFDTEDIVKRINASFAKQPPTATAFICDMDLTAAALMRALRSIGKIPGKDIAVVGFDDQPVSSLLEPPLTSVRTFEPELADACVEALVYNMEHPGARFRHIRIGTELIIRASTYAQDK